MKNFEFFRNLSIGQYVEADSPVHGLSPAAKYLWLIAMITVASFSRSSLVLLALALTVLGFTLLAKVRPLFLLRGFLPVLPLLAFAALLQVIFTWAGDTSPALMSLGPVSITAREAWLVAGMAFRFFAIMLAIGLFTSVTTEGDSARGVEDLCMPLSRLGFPAHALALAVAVAFRFIPIVAGEFESVVKAQASRGADFCSRGLNPVRKARAYLPLIVPVTIRALERAEALAEAMEARCYSATGRTRYVRSPGGPRELWLGLGAVAYAILALALGSKAPF